MTADQVIRLLGLEPLPQEGGFFRETYRSTSAHGERSLATAIYFLITPATFSALHRLRFDEVYHHYAGAPVHLLLLEAGGASREVVLGSDLEAGQRPQHLVRGGTWQGSWVAGDCAWALLGTTMAPGFVFADFELGERTKLEVEFPERAAAIYRLTRDQT